MAAGTAARDAALAILRGVRDGRPFDAALEQAISGHPDDADRRLAHEIAAGVLRTRTELDRRVAPLVRGEWRRLSPDLRDLLRIGAYQLVRLSRVPAYAAVETAVEIAKRTNGRKAAGLVNAVLRRLAREGSGPGPAQDLAAEHSHPAWLVDRWVARYGATRTASLLRHNNSRPPVVLQPVCWSRAELTAALDARSVTWRDAPLGAGVVVATTRVSTLPGYAQGGFIVQDAAQAYLLARAAIPDDALVWDACAAPGGKSAVLGRRCRVVASELRVDRVGRLVATLRRVRSDVPVVVADARTPAVRTASMDAVLVDAPCTATGTMARHPDARWRLSARRLAGLVRRQREILDGVAPVVRPGRLLVYMTCSLEPEENEDQVDRFLDRWPAFRRDGADDFVFPPDAGTDGGYAARLRRTT